MKKSQTVLLIALGIFIFSASAQANLLTNGDFQNGSQVILGDFSSSSGPYSVWLGTHGIGSQTLPGEPTFYFPIDWWTEANGMGGKGVGDYYAKHWVNTSNFSSTVVCDVVIVSYCND